jgi:hypothetical protein
LSQGKITNSDLEPTILVLHQDILAQHQDICELTFAAMTNNMAALSWEQHGSTLVYAPSAFLCRLLAFHQQAYRYRLQCSYIPGPLNVMAYSCWDLDDSQLLAHFNSVFLQKQPWQLCLLRSEMHSGVILGLSKKPCNMGFLRAVKLPQPLSKSGKAFVNNTSWTPTLLKSKIQSSGFKSYTVADALTFVAQTFTFMGIPDPRFQIGQNILHPKLA